MRKLLVFSLGERLEDGGVGAEAYADAVATYLALGVSRTADYCNVLCTWHTTRDNSNSSIYSASYSNDVGLYRI